MILFLACAEADFVTGATFSIDGGFVAGRSFESERCGTANSAGPQYHFLLDRSQLGHFHAHSNGISGRLSNLSVHAR